MKFTYKAVNASGQSVEGVLEAHDESAVLARLNAQGLIPIRVQTGSAEKKKSFSFKRRGVGVGALMGFTTQIHSLLEAGIPLDRSLGLCVGEGTGAKMSLVAQTLRRDVLEGKTLSEGMEGFPEIFNKLYRALVQTGERSGDLASAFAKLEEHITGQQEIRSTVLTAMIYPAFLTVISGGSVIFLMTFVVPKFTQVLTDTGRPLPLATLILLVVTGFLMRYGWLAPIALVALVWGFRRAVANPVRRLRWDRWKLGWPVVGELLRCIEVTRFSRVFSTLMRAGVPMLPAMRMVRDTLSNTAMAGRVGEVAEGLKEGQPVSEPLSEGGLFPAKAIQMMSIGEETGRLEEMLDKVAETYTRETQQSVRRLMSLLEPVVILGMGLVIGTIVISILMGIVAVNDIPTG